MTRKCRQFQHKLVVGLSSEIDRGQRQMQNRLIKWLAANGHTSSNFGFEFRTVGVITGKLIQSELEENDK